MNKLLPISLVCAILLNAHEVELAPISVEATAVMSDVASEELKSADLADALNREVPSISMVRRSGIANDIILRGQKKDNINVLVDGTKTYGACPNRMDPAISHVLTNNIDSVVITTGPYDVENFGTLSGAVDIKTVKPQEDVHGNVNLNAGSFGYKKASADISGGYGPIKMMVSASTESSGQYQDGDGNTLSQQVDNYILTHPTLAGTAYQDQYKDIDAYTKSTLMTKLFIDITDNQELRLSYVGNRSDDVLYPSSKMDALYDDSNLYNIEYLLRDLGTYSKQLSFQYYYSEVAHPMSTYYRKSSGPNSVNEVISKLQTSMQGAKIKNAFDVTDTMVLTLGLDASQRNWDGSYTGYGTKTPVTGRISIDNVNTNNVAFFTHAQQDLDALTLRYGLRYDATTIAPKGSQKSNDYQALSANIFANYDVSSNLKFFGGVGKASRVPDARELYFKSSMGNEVGTPDLDQVTNYEVDLGMENGYDSFVLKTKLFYSYLENYIAYNDSKKVTMGPMMVAKNAFENVNASIYGLEMSGSYFLNDTVYFDAGVAYQRGEKEEALTNQTGTNLAEIPPLKGNISWNWDYARQSSMRFQVIASDEWNDFDAENGEQYIGAYAIMNFKVKHQYDNGVGITLGIDNIADTTYAISNTYKDLTLLTDGTSNEIILLNEPGRYFYANVSYSF